MNSFSQTDFSDISSEKSLKSPQKNLLKGNSLIQPSALWIHDCSMFQIHGVLAGVDEVGRGPLAGAVVAACVVLDLEAEAIDGLNDSKKLSEKKRLELVDIIKSRALFWGIGICSETEIDRLNILQASLLAMKRALEQSGAQPKMVLVDGNKTIPQLQFPQCALVKGDSRSASIAAASIIAKVKRDEMLVELDAMYPEYGFAIHKGYPTRAHTDALSRCGPCPVHRRSFLKNYNQSDLFEDALEESQISTNSENPFGTHDLQNEAKPGVVQTMQSLKIE